MRPLTGAIYEAREAYVPVLEERGTPQDLESDVAAHHVGAIAGGWVW